MGETMLKTAAELVAAAVEKGKESLAHFQNTVIPRLKVKIEGCLSRSNIIQAIRDALNQVGVTLEEDSIKAAIQEMVDQEDITVVNVDVLDIGSDDLLAELEIECEQVDFDLRPGDIIYEEF